MSLLSGLFADLEKASAPRFFDGETKARHDTAKRACDTRIDGGSTPPAADDQPPHAVKTAATASPEWRQSRDRYISHLMACRACHAPTGRYCANGATLRDQYDNTPMEPTR